MTSLSIILCAHNPGRKALERTLQALQKQSMPREQWELLLVDNASTPALSGEHDLHWHPRARHVREDKIGLTNARLRGIKESVGSLLLFVDDDNILAGDYLEAAVRIGEKWPQLGAWGGQVVPLYEEDPPAELRKWIDDYFVRKLEREVWTNVGKTMETTPVGSGMVVRRIVACEYANLTSSDPIRASLDRAGESLSSCGDIDLSWGSHRLGLGTGLFPSLTLEHLVPKRRMTKKYLLALTEACAFSNQLLRWFWGLPLAERSRSEVLYRLYQDFRLPSLERAFSKTRLRGETKGRALISRLGKT
jgi:glycosyltransferase involved in cell wall biosynthesis